MRIFSYMKKSYLDGHVIMSIIMVILVVVLQVTILQTLFSKEKYLIQKELYETTLWSIGYWSGKEADRPDGIVRNSEYIGSTRELFINLGDKKYKFKIDSLESAFEVEAMVSYDLNLINPLTLANLDSLVRGRLKNETQNIPIVFRKIDSLGNIREVYPRGNIIYMNMEEAGYIRLGYISGERVGVLFNYSWKNFLHQFWWGILGVIVIGSIIDVLIIVFLMQIRKHRRMKMLQERVFRQRLHDLGNPISVIEVILHRICEENPDVFKKENERCWFETGVNAAVMVKQEISETLNMAVMLYTKRVEWEEMNLQEELNKLASEFKLANRGKKEVNITVHALPGQFKLSKQLVYAIRNLVDNAVKYSGDVADVTITVYREKKYLMLTVADRGKGIAEKDLPYIFEEYWRVGKEKKTTGYGLGLASVRKIVRRHRGKVFVVSSLGSGTKFTIKIRDYGTKNKAFIRRGSIGNT